MRVLRRKPWRSNEGWWKPQAYEPTIHDTRLIWLAVQIGNLTDWVRHAHDCQDPKVGCSCSGSYRFPTSTEATR